MQWKPFTDSVRTQLNAAAALGDERTRQVADALATTVESAVRMAVLDAVTAAAVEITSSLHDANVAAESPAVSVQLDGAEIRFVVTAPLPAAEVDEPASARTEDGEPTARISFRLSETLKVDIEQAAGRADLSVNSWLIKAASTALRPPSKSDWAGWNPSSGRVTGWITG